MPPLARATAFIIAAAALLTACGQGYRDYYPWRPPAGAYEAYLRSRIHREHGEYEKALEALEDARLLDRESPRLQAEKADLLRLQGKLPAALIILNEEIDDHPDFTHALFVRALTYRDLGKIDDALQDLRQVTEADPGNADASFELARHAIDSNNLPLARQTLERLVDARPDFARGWLALGHLAWEQKEWQRSVDAYGEFLELSSRSELAFLHLADAHRRLDAPTDAEDVLAECVERVPRSLECKVQFIQAVVKTPETDDLAGRIDTLVLSVSHDADSFDQQLLVDLALRILATQPLETSSPFVEAVLLRRPDLGDLGYHLGRARVNAGDCPGALRALGLVGDNSDVRVPADALIGRCQLDRGHLEEAHMIAERLIDEHGDRPEGFLLKSRVLRKKGKWDEAVTVLEQALGNTANRARILVQLGHLQELRGQYDQAIARYEAVIQSAASDEFAIPGAGARELTTAKAGLARVLTVRGERLEEADLLIQDVLEAESDSAGELRLSDRDGAVEADLKVLTRASELRPERADVLVAIADLHARIGNLRQAVEAFRAALEHTNDQAQRAEILNRIDALTVLEGDRAEGSSTRIPETIEQ